MTVNTKSNSQNLAYSAHLSIARTLSSQLWHSVKSCNLMFNAHLIFHSCPNGQLHGCLLFLMGTMDHRWHAAINSSTVRTKWLAESIL